MVWIAQGLVSFATPGTHRFTIPGVTHGSLAFLIMSSSTALLRDASESLPSDKSAGKVIDSY